jgi:hypothetical protein
MNDLALSDAFSDVPEKFDQRKNLKPWPKGVSGCPGGLRSNGKRYRALYATQEAASIPIRQEVRFASRCSSLLRNGFSRITIAPCTFIPII